ncbi:MAG: biopolymer transporter ExbD [Epsilonproteobacteria bacterium]|nr:biopolymer transporter ExbD [Campylobacterota bacterium]OIO16328.1 MAG: hypothetical protein AUJ81_04680 [Helicobacteraceae bacterium CG1_02_36_14]PIP09530.1 MAG: hypothetical protein COX50_10475 [Sulfurimonas sp. CG23_combo_of_CG06-09_8_20_14_all_36_33]PIS24875.1 MAG: hypothetical protein COT46_07860 [Sulfurimonas sp. CG08_land_8_20_14_0_20_36_33]PIU33600.1 MAG: hypothetical protein COT05_11305 [Sulfurimonas sp. CG07_land_8_20_14_0_80_36_56]PIV05561.1 MAG: hypothetical protein COS56_00835 
MRRGKKRAQFHLDIAPVNLIDLLLVLLIFFVTTTTFLQLKVVELNLPDAKNSETEYLKDLTYVINIKEDCSLFLDDKAVAMDALGLEIQTKFQNNQKSLFQIAAHQDSPHHCFIEVLDLLKESGIENISILTKLKEQ